jgi:hypothetical protein
MSKKVVITNFVVLKSKYGSAGVTKIRSALKAVIAADAGRGFETSVVDVANAAAMRKVGAKKVTSSSSPKQNKDAVDAIYRASAPEYLVLLGAPDVVPHIDLLNPVYGRDDPDQFAPGDLPYACEATYSQNVQDFIGPTRVVGRIPDVAGTKDPAYFLGLLDVAAKWQSRPVSDYQPHLGISAAVWVGSTTLSLKRIFGPTVDVKLAPPKGPQWTNAELAPLSHFINCHGAEVDPRYYGQEGNSYPISHDAAWVDGKIKEGTVASVECCYGALLYDPAPVAGQQIGIANTYMANRAYGFFGSTTIAYGPADGNGSADLLCQYFLQRVLGGASLGRAALEARQQFAQGAASLDPVDLKTLAQMNLLGDPSIHPVAKSTPHVVVSAKAMRGMAQDTANAGAARADRRRQLFTRGLSIAQTQSVAHFDVKVKPGAAVMKTLRQLVSELKLGEAEILSYRITSPALPKTPMMKRAFGVTAMLPRPSHFHVVMGKHAESSLKTPQITAVVAKEEGGKIVSYRQLISR